MFWDDFFLDLKAEFRGFWWIPETTDEMNKVAGVLTFTPGEGLYLLLQGGLDSEENRQEMNPISIILGEFNEGKITLENCNPTLISFGLSSEQEVRESKIYVSRAFFGGHFTSTDDILFDSMYVQMRHLGSWLWNTSAIDVEYKKEPHRQTIRINPPTTIRYEIDEGICIGIAYSQEGPNRNIAHGNMNVTLTPHVIYEATNPFRLDDGLSELIHFRNFLSLGVGQPCPIFSIEGIIRGEESDDHPDSYPRRIRVLFESLSAQSSSQDVHPHQMIFTYNAFSDQMQSLIEKWYLMDENLRIVLNLYFSTRFFKDMFVESQFMYLIQSLESYHRLKFESKVMDKEDYSRNTKLILQNTPDGIYKKLAEQALNFGNRKTLFERLVELTNKYGQNIFVEYCLDKEEFLRRVTKTRHYRTHFDPKRSRNVFEPNEMGRAYRILRILMEVCFLVELGFESDEAQGMILAKSKYFV